MNKIEEAIYEIHSIDNKANADFIINKIHPLVKLLISAIYIILLTSIDKYDLITTFAMSIYLIVISIIGNLSIRDCIKKVKIMFVCLIAIGIANVIFDRNIIIYIGGISITTGMVSMITLILKGVFSIISAYLLIVTTKIEDICCALKQIHMPNILITIFMLIYRYIVLFLKEVQRLWTAYSLRAPKQKGFNYKAWGSMIGNLMIRSIDKAEIVYESMEIRGFTPDTFFAKKQRLDRKSCIYFILDILLLFIIRFIPIFNIIGNLFCV